MGLEQNHELSAVGKREAEGASLRRPKQALYMTVQPYPLMGVASSWASAMGDMLIELVLRFVKSRN